MMDSIKAFFSACVSSSVGIGRDRRGGIQMVDGLAGVCVIVQDENVLFTEQ